MLMGLLLMMVISVVADRLRIVTGRGRGGVKVTRSSSICGGRIVVIGTRLSCNIRRVGGGIGVAFSMIASLVASGSLGAVGVAVIVCSS